MEQKAEIITLGVRDLDASREFYIDGLGWEAALDVPGEVIFIQIGHGLLLSLWGIDDMVAEAGGVGFGEKAPTVAFGHLVEILARELLLRHDAVERIEIGRGGGNCRRAEQHDDLRAGDAALTAPPTPWSPP